MIKLSVEGKTMAEVNKAVLAMAAEIGGDVKVEVEVKEAAAKADATTDEKVADFDTIEYSGQSTPRNLWILLTNGQVIEIKAGGNLPIDAQREKNIKKAEYVAIAKEEPERVAKSIAEEIDEKAKEVSKKRDKKADKEEPVEDVDADEDEESNDDMDKAKELVKEAKEFAGGKKFIKDLLEDYEARRVTNITDAEDLADFIEEVEEYIEEQED